MPTLEFKGKQHIYAHHLTVPYRPLISDSSRSLNPEEADDNLVIHGDNLHALKALLPCYAGKIKCIYIDPPYNTGNERWVYNDRVNSPLMKEWFEQQSPVDGEDLERHDKWMCMMWPRLHLIKELLAENGVIFVSIDDNEQHHLRMMMDEVFGLDNFIACLPTVMNLKGNNDEFGFAGTHEYTLAWAKDRTLVNLGEFELDDEELESWQRDEYGYFKKGAGLKATGANAPRNRRPHLYFPIYVGSNNEILISNHVDAIPDDYEKVLPTTNGEEMSWRWSEDKIASAPHEIIVERTNNGIRLHKKQRPSIGDLPSKKPKSLLYKPEYSSSTSAAEIKSIFGEKVYDYPKPVSLLKDLISISTDANDIVLDSFAGSGTTAHAVLALNKEDDGNRKFILVECEDYCDCITAERVRRVIGGISNARNSLLREGLEGSFSYFTLGDPIDIEGMLTGGALPDYQTLAAYLLYTTAGISTGVDILQPEDEDGLFFSSDTTNYYLLYRPDVGYLSNNEAMLNEERARRISISIQEAELKAIVFGPGKYMGQRDLTAMGITFCQLPYEMHRTETIRG